MRTLHNDKPTPLQTWCVRTEDGQRFVLDYAGNGGFGPVNIHSNGLLVPVIYRHLLQHGNINCPVCLDPPQARTYLPPILWKTPDPTRSAVPGSGDPDRGVFEAVFRGGPEHRRMWVEVFRRDWWRHWHSYANLELNPRSDWRSIFDGWRRLATGYQPESADSTNAAPGVEQQSMSSDNRRTNARHAARAAVICTNPTGDHVPFR